MRSTKAPLDQSALDRLVAEADTGGRAATGFEGRLIYWLAIAWSLFQLWYASPLPFDLGFGVFDSTEARAIHLAFAMFLAFACFPALKRSSRARVPAQDWIFAAVGAFCAAYIFLFYAPLATRPGQPIALDIVAAVVGMILLAEATRRSLGAPMVVLAIVFALYTALGPMMPEALAHKGASLTKIVNHQWLTTEGVYGVALGVSVGQIFVFVLFGALLDKAGAGNYLLQVSFALLGHLRGGPAKVSVLSSALNGVVSGSSVSNVVSGGIFTITMMKRYGYGGVKAGAIETASSTNGQLMPPVMGAAAFLMVEYVGIPYSEIIKHAALPAVGCYLALLYIVHLEALKLGMQPLERAMSRPLPQRLIRTGIGLSGTIIVFALVYAFVEAVNSLFGSAAGLVLAAATGALNVAVLAYSARFPDLALDDPNKPIVRVPELWPVARTGLHFLIPVTVLVWCLTADQLTPALAAFWACLAMIAILATQGALLALFRGTRDAPRALARGLRDTLDALELGARNMIGIGVATAMAGFIVGSITLTGIGLMLTEFIESIAGGSGFLMLLVTAFISLLLGMGVPTTANYILVATLMAPIVVELGAQGGLVIPLIAVHLFVFYFGIMADVTPPVGLASFAAAAISGEDPIKTGIQGSIYELRTAILPFMFIYNPQILLIDVGGVVPFVATVAATLAATLLFSAVTMGWFAVRSRWYETALLVASCLLLFRPDLVMDRLYAPLEDAAASRLMQQVDATPPGGRVIVVIEGTDIDDGRTVRKTISLPLEEKGTATERLRASGADIVRRGDQFVVGQVRFGSYAKRMRLEPGWTVVGLKVPADRPSPHWVCIPALLLAGFVYLLLRRRTRHGAAPFVIRAPAP